MVLYIEALFVCVEPLCPDAESVFSGIVAPFYDKSEEVQGNSFRIESEEPEINKETIMKIG